MILFYAVLAVTAGIFFAVQGPVNAALGKKTNSYFATTVSFFGGMMILLIICAVDRFGTMNCIFMAKPWMLIGGLYGAFGVCVSIVALPKLGVALTLMVSMLGQLLTGVVLDYFGWLYVPRSDVTLLRIIGIAVIAFGVYLIFLDNRHSYGSVSHNEKNRIFYLVLVLISGITGGLQAPTNAAAASIIGSLEGTLLSFCTGFFAISIVTLVMTKGKLPPLYKSGIKPWMVVGGAYGVCGVFLNMITVKLLGAALLTAGSTLGQLLCGLFIDSTGLIQSNRVKITKTRFLGVTAVALGVAFVTIAKLK